MCLTRIDPPIEEPVVPDWVLRFKVQGLIDRKAPGQPSRLNDEHRAAPVAMVASGPIPAVHGVVRWRVIDLCQWLWGRTSGDRVKAEAEPRAAGDGLPHSAPFSTLGLRWPDLIARAAASKAMVPINRQKFCCCAVAQWSGDPCQETSSGSDLAAEVKHINSRDILARTIMTNSGEPSSANHAQANREKIRDSLNGITAELNSALVSAKLAYPIYLCVPTTGDAIMTFACSVDPKDSDWKRMNETACEIVGRKIGLTRLKATELACAMAGTTMGAAELAVG
jgi:hypothetical protein